MQVFSLALLFLLFLRMEAGELKTVEISSDVLVYRTKSDGEQLELNFERHIWSEVLFLWSWDLENRSSEETLVVVSQKILSEREFLESLEAWKTRRHEFKYLRLSCSNEATENSESTCICTSYVRSSNRTNRITTVSSAAVKSTIWIRTSISHCPTLPRLGSHDFRDFPNVSVLDFDQVRFGVVEPGTFRQLHSLQLVRFLNISMSIDQVARGTFCGLSKLRSVQIFGILMGHGDRGSAPNDVIHRLLSCDVDNNSISSTESVRTDLLDIRDASMMSLSGNVFGDLTRDRVRSIFLSWNSIQSIGREAFLGFRNAVELDISRNLITMLESPIFSELFNLEYLNLEFNRLEILDIAIFDNLVSLRKLNLTGNRIFIMNGGFSVLPSLVCLNLGGNRLSTVNEVVVSNCSRLEQLWLGGNEIADVHENALKGTYELRILDLSHNRLFNETNFKSIFQHNLKNLTNIRLGNNSLLRLLPYTFRPKTATYKSNLLAVDLSSNQLEYIDRDAFVDHENLLVLVLQFNKLTNLHPDTFSSNINLRYISVAYNLLESLVSLPDSVLELMASYNRIKHLPLFNKTMPNLWALNLEGNNLSSIDNDSFANFPKLKVLLVGDCNLSQIAEDSFRNNPELQSVFMSKNNLDLNFSVDYFKSSVSLYWLDFSRNRIRSARNLFLHKIRSAITIDLSHNPLRTFPDQPSDVKIAISTLRLVMINCSLESVSEFSLVQASSLVVLDLTSNRLKEFSPLQLSDRVTDTPYQVILDDNPIQCSCHMTWLAENQYARHYRVPYCYRSTSRTLVPFYSMSKDEFLCRVTEYCTVELPQCDCYAESTASSPTYLDCSGKDITVFPKNIQPSMKVLCFEDNALASFTRGTVSKRLENLEKLFLGNNRISELEPFSFEMFPNLLLLNLSRNRISHLRNGVFAKLRKLNILYLHDNFILEIDSTVLSDLHLLNVLTLHNNSLSFLSDESMHGMSSLAYLGNLTLYGNPWSCPCDNATFKYWIQLHEDIIPNISEVLCNDTPILTIPDEVFLCYDQYKIVLLSEYHPELLLAVCSLSVLVLLVLVFVYRYRYPLQVLVYSRFQLRRKQKENESCLYDAIAIYNSSDEAVRRWIKDVLLPHFEPKFNLYIPDRDMLPGSVESSEIAENIRLSRRTIIVLSQGAEEKREIQFALEAADDRVRIKRSRHRVIIVGLDAVSRKRLLDNSRLNECLKAYLTAGQFLCTADKLFWDKMAFFMPRSVSGKEGSRDQDYAVTRESVPLTAQRP